MIVLRTDERIGRNDQVITNYISNWMHFVFLLTSQLSWESIIMKIWRWRVRSTVTAFIYPHLLLYMGLGQFSMYGPDQAQAQAQTEQRPRAAFWPLLTTMLAVEGARVDRWTPKSPWWRLCRRWMSEGCGEVNTWRNFHLLLPPPPSLFCLLPSPRPLR